MHDQLTKSLLLALLFVLTVAQNCSIEVDNNKYIVFTNGEDYTADMNMEHEIYCRFGYEVNRKLALYVYYEKHMHGYSLGNYMIFCNSSTDQLFLIKEDGNFTEQLNINELCQASKCSRKPDEPKFNIAHRPPPYKTGKFDCIVDYLPAHPSSEKYIWLYCNNNTWASGQTCHPICQISPENTRHLQALDDKTRHNATQLITCERGYQDKKSTTKSITIKAWCMNGELIYRNTSQPVECVLAQCLLPAPNALHVEINDQYSALTGLIIPCRQDYAPPISKGETDSIELLCYKGIWEGRGENDVCLNKCYLLIDEAYDPSTLATNNTGQEGSQTQIVCRPGFYIENLKSATVICQNGSYIIENTNQIGECKPAHCSSPPDSSEFHIISTNEQYSGVSVSCADGYATHIHNPNVSIRLVCESDMWQPFNDNDVCLPMCTVLAHGSPDQKPLREGDSQMSQCMTGYVPNTLNVTYCYNSSLVYKDFDGEYQPVICEDESIIAQRNAQNENTDGGTTSRSWFLPVVISASSILLIIFDIVIILIFKKRSNDPAEFLTLDEDARCDELMKPGDDLSDEKPN